MGIGRESVVGKNFVGDQREITLPAQADQPLELGEFHEGSGGIVGIDQHHRARTPGDGGRQALQVDGPAAMIDQRVRVHLNRFHAGQIVEQGVRRPRRQHVIAGIRQKLKKIGVGFAGAGGQEDA